MKNQSSSKKTRANGLKLQHRRFKLDIKKDFYMESIVIHWNRFPSLKLLKISVDMAVEDVV